MWGWHAKKYTNMGGSKSEGKHNYKASSIHTSFHNTVKM